MLQVSVPAQGPKTRKLPVLPRLGKKLGPGAASQQRGINSSLQTAVKLL